MQVVIRSENIGSYNVSLEVSPTIYGVIYKATLNTEQGGYYTTSKHYESTDKKKAAAAYRRYKKEATGYTINF